MSVRSIAIKVLSLFSTVRLYNIALVTIAQLLAALFILAPDWSPYQVVSDYKLWLILVASAAAISGGYIINNFYDREKDFINRPQKTLLEHQVSRFTLWQVYFTVNAIAFLLGLLVSWRAGLFFAAYIFAMWWYSHRVKRLLFLGNLMAALLAITPFFVLFAYYKNSYLVIFVHGAFLFLILAMRELIKDLENLRGDLIHGYKTIPVVMGERASKTFYTVLSVFTIFPVLALWLYFDIGYMKYYFAFISGGILISLPLLWDSTRKREYLLIHFILKVILAGGVFSILLIDLQNIIDRINNLIL